MKAYLFAIVSLIPFSVLASENEPVLKDFPTKASSCTANKLDSSDRDITSKEQKSILKERLGKNPDFAGHYYLIDFPTPKGGVRDYVVLDCITGRIVARLPKAYEDYSEDNYKNGYYTQLLPSSRLLIMRGVVTDPELAHIYQSEFYEMKDGKLNLLRRGPPKIVKKK